MALPLPKQDVLGVLKALRDEIATSVLAPRGLTLKSSGTKDLTLTNPLDTSVGYWQDPKSISTKPPRWIVQVEVDPTGSTTARFALDAAGNEYDIAHTIGYANNHAGDMAVYACRVLLAVRTHGATSWVFPDGWECLLLLGFSSPLHAGTSGDPLRRFDPSTAKVAFGAGTREKVYDIGLQAIVKATGATRYVGASYDDAVAAVASLLGVNFYDGNIAADHARLVTDLTALYTTTGPGGPFELEPDSALVGIDPLVYKQISATVNSGKRHIILYGPPGTGKTTLAEYLAREISDHDGSDGSYVMLTASSAWSAQDLVGGYQPAGGGTIKFVEGTLLRGFDRPLIIDELNRCPIDKVIGPLFSVLSGQSSTLPYRTDVSDASSDFHVVLPATKPGMKAHEHAPGDAWRLICTLNTYDKTQLGQISYALSRRFAWIKVGSPEDLDGFVVTMATRLTSVAVPTPVPANPVALMWAAVNKVREIGGAPIIDFIKIVRELDPAVDLFALPVGDAVPVLLAAVQMCVLPLMDGLSPHEAESLAIDIALAWQVGQDDTKRLQKDFVEFSA